MNGKENKFMAEKMKRERKDIGERAIAVNITDPELMDLLIAYYEGKHINVTEPSPVDSVEVPLPNGCILCAENDIEADSDHPAIYIGLKKDGVYFQDLVAVRAKYHYENSDTPVIEDGKYEILVFGDAKNEDYTDRFEVDEYREPAEE